jgi:orotate phosphoribosyltransferase
MASQPIPAAKFSSAAIPDESIRDEHADQDRALLIEELRTHALILGEVTLSSGATAEYYVDAKRAALMPRPFGIVGRMVAAEASKLRASAVGGLIIGAAPVVGATLGAGADVKGFLVRKEQKSHGLQRWIEGPPLTPHDRCLVVDDVVTTGRSVIDAIHRLRSDEVEVVGVVAILDRLQGGDALIRDAVGDVPYACLTTIDDVYPERPDR